jgi:hypothetical protein
VLCRGASGIGGLDGDEVNPSASNGIAALPGGFFFATSVTCFSKCLEKVRFRAPNAEMARGLETFLTAMVLGFASGSPVSADPLLREFAVCAGRYSALVEHLWLVDGPASERAAEMRDGFLALVEAVEEPGMEAAVMGWRIEAKAGQRALLQRTFFTQDQAAGTRSSQLLQGCTDLIGQS